MNCYRVAGVPDEVEAPEVPAPAEPDEPPPDDVPLPAVWLPSREVRCASLTAALTAGPTWAPVDLASDFAACAAADTACPWFFAAPVVAPDAELFPAVPDRPDLDDVALAADDLPVAPERLEVADVEDCVDDCPEVAAEPVALFPWASWTASLTAAPTLVPAVFASA
jgi:hypothetical protein